MRKLSITARRRFLERKQKIELSHLGQFTLDEAKIANRNCENMIGATQVPVGIAGPVKINRKFYYLPLATTEGALVASVNRGAKATRLSGGINGLVEDVGATRAPVFRVKNLQEGMKLSQQVKKRMAQLKKIAAATSPHLKLLGVQPTLLGRNVYLRFIFNTREAMGMNMVSKASQAMVRFIEKRTKAECVATTGNLCVDKKPAWQNALLGRGKKVWAEAMIKRKVVEEILKTTSEKIAEVVYRKCLLGSALAGSLGYNAHFANIVAALFLATGQDMAHVVEGSLGITTAEVLKNGSLYFSVYLPDLMVGTVGGGTTLDTQKEALKILGLGKGKRGEAVELAQIVGSAVLCGEVSLLAALAAGHLAKAHERLGRGKK